MRPTRACQLSIAALSTPNRSSQLLHTHTLAHSHIHTLTWLLSNVYVCLLSDLHTPRHKHAVALRHTQLRRRPDGSVCALGAGEGSISFFTLSATGERITECVTVALGRRGPISEFSWALSGATLLITVNTCMGLLNWVDVTTGRCSSAQGIHDSSQAVRFPLFICV